jgi:hypothetical protein
MGIENYSPMLGHDLTNLKHSNRAMMQYAENFAYMVGNEVTILQPNKAPLNFRYEKTQHRLIPQVVRNELSEVALAHVLWGSLAYKNNWHADTGS